LRPWPSNNRSDIKAQFFLKKQVKSSLILKETKVEGENTLYWFEKKKIIYPFHREGGYKGQNKISTLEVVYGSDIKRLLDATSH
jgi:hypothetical protein